MRHSSLIAAIVVMAILGFGRAWGETAPAFGISYSFFRVDTSKITACPRADPIGDGAFLPRYDDPAVRSKVLSDLKTMRDSGLTGMRTLIFFGETEETPGDWFDSVRDIERAPRIVARYANDVAAAGFKSLFLDYARLGRASPSCRRQSWGDCFDSATVSHTLAFVTRIRAALDAKPALPLVSDISPEGCVASGTPKGLAETLRQYGAAMIAGYKRAFPADRAAVSCNFELFAQGGKESIDAIFAEAGLKPDVYLVAAYDRPGVDAETASAALAQSLRGSTVPYIVSETTYGNRPHLDLLLDRLTSAGRGPEAVYFWPLHDAADHCQVDVAPPYSLDAALGH